MAHFRQRILKYQWSIREVLQEKLSIRCPAISSHAGCWVLFKYIKKWEAWSPPQVKVPKPINDRNVIMEPEYQSSYTTSYRNQSLPILVFWRKQPVLSAIQCLSVGKGKVCILKTLANIPLEFYEEVLGASIHDLGKTDVVRHDQDKSLQNRKIVGNSTIITWFEWTVSVKSAIDNSSWNYLKHKTLLPGRFI